MTVKDGAAYHLRSHSHEEGHSNLGTKLFLSTHPDDFRRTVNVRAPCRSIRPIIHYSLIKLATLKQP